MAEQRAAAFERFKYALGAVNISSFDRYRIHVAACEYASAAAQEMLAEFDAALRRNRETTDAGMLAEFDAALGRIGDHFDIPSARQYPLSYPWHLGSTWEDREALLARADAVEAEREKIERQIVAANDADDMGAYDRLEEEHALACRELSLLRKRIEEL